MAFYFSFTYHYHLDIELFAVVCMPVKCFSLFVILFFIQSSPSHGEYTCSIYIQITYLCTYELVVNDWTTDRIILNYHCVTIIIVRQLSFPLISVQNINLGMIRKLMLQSNFHIYNSFLYVSVNVRYLASGRASGQLWSWVIISEVCAAPTKSSKPYGW